MTDDDILSRADLDAFGHLEYTIGWTYESDDAPEDDDRGDWLACLDFDMWVEGGLLVVAYHVVVDSDSGGFTEEVARGVVTRTLRPDMSMSFLPTDLAEEWLAIAEDHLAGTPGLTPSERAEAERTCAEWEQDLNDWADHYVHQYLRKQGRR